MAIKHSFTSLIPDEADTSLVRPSNWNADHTIEASSINNAHLSVTSLLVPNLNADLLDGYEASAFSLTGHNHSGIYEVPLTFSTGLQRAVNTITTKDSEINHNALQNYASNQHFLQTDITNVSTALLSGLLKVTTGTGVLSVVSPLSDFVPPSRAINTASPLSGGGDLSADRTHTLAGLSSLGTANYLVGVNSAATAWEYKSLLGTTNQLTVTHSAGGVTLSTPQDIHTAASPTFVGLTLTGLTGVLQATAGVISGSANHSALGNLTTGDDHTQYVLLAGRAGGQAIYGGINANDNLYLYSTSHATKGYIISTARSQFTPTLVGTTNPGDAGIKLYPSLNLSADSSLRYSSLDATITFDQNLSLDNVATAGLVTNYFNTYIGSSFLVGKTITIAAGAYGGIQTQAGATGTITNAYAYYAKHQLSGCTMSSVMSFYSFPNVSGATITNLYGFYAADPSNVSGTIANCYGIYIATQTKGTAKNFNFYSGGTGVSAHAGYFRFGGITVPTEVVDITGNQMTSGYSKCGDLRPIADGASGIIIKDLAATKNIVVIDTTYGRIGLNRTPNFANTAMEVTILAETGIVKHLLNSHAAGCEFVGLRAQGTKTTPTFTTANVSLVGLMGAGYSSAWLETTYAARIDIFSAESYENAGYVGGYITFKTRTTGGGTPAMTERVRIQANGNIDIVGKMQIGSAVGTTPTALLHLAAGSATANTAPLLFTSGAVEATPRAGLVEYNGRFVVTESDAANRFLVQAAASTKTTAAAPYTNDGYVSMVINGTSIKVMTTA